MQMNHRKRWCNKGHVHILHFMDQRPTKTALFHAIVWLGIEFCIQNTCSNPKINDRATIISLNGHNHGFEAGSSTSIWRMDGKAHNNTFRLRNLFGIFSYLFLFLFGNLCSAFFALINFQRCIGRNVRLKPLSPAWVTRFN